MSWKKTGKENKTVEVICVHVRDRNLYCHKLRIFEMFTWLVTI